MTNDELQAQLEARLEAIYASTSWKITAPVRMAGTAVILCKRGLRSPRAAAKRALSAMLSRTIPLIKRSPVLRHWALRLCDRFPALAERLVQHAKPTLFVSTESSIVPPAILAADVTYAWSAGSPTHHFKTMLSRELRERSQ